MTRPSKGMKFMKILQTLSLYALPALLLYLFVVPAGYQFSQTEYKPVKEILCPGEELVYTSEAKTSANTIAHRYRTIIDLNNDVNVVTDKVGDVLIWKSDKTVKREVRYTIPEIKPGRYLFMVALESRSHPPIMYQVPFTVPLTCK